MADLHEPQFSAERNMLGRGNGNPVTPAHSAAPSSGQRVDTQAEAVGIRRDKACAEVELGRRQTRS